MERFAKLNVLISNAGIAPLSRLDDLRVEEWEELIDSHQRCPVRYRGGAPHLSPTGLRAFRQPRFHRGPHHAADDGRLFQHDVCGGAISEGLRQEAGDKLRVTIISPGFVKTNLTDSMADPEVKAQIGAAMNKMAISPDAGFDQTCCRQSEGHCGANTEGRIRRFCGDSLAVSSQINIAEFSSLPIP